MMKALGLVACAVIALPATAFSATTTSAQPAPASSAWKGSVSLGFLRTTGNTDSSNLNFAANVDWKKTRWENLFNAQAISAQSDHDTSAESYQIGDQVNFDFTPRDYVFGHFNYLNDRFAGIVERYTETAGYGRHVIKTPTQTLNLQIGIGANQQREAGSHTLRTSLIGVFDGAYTWQITPTSQFKQTLHVESGKNDTYVNPITSLKLTIDGNLYTSLSYEVRYNSRAPAGVVHTDTITSVNLGYNFGKK